MAFEQEPPPQVTVTRTEVTERGFDGSAFIGIIIGILILAGILFLFRNSIASKIAEWRDSGEVVSTRPTPPTVSAVPTLTPTPTATATAVAVRSASPLPVYGTLSDEFPESGPADTAALALLGAGSLGAAGLHLRTRYYKRRLKREINSIDIA